MPGAIEVKGRMIGPGQPIFLTAEVGCSHMGRLDHAQTLLRAAAEGGCDGVDTFLWEPNAFNWRGTLSDGSPITVLEDLCLRPEEWRQLHDLADELGIILYHTPCDPPSVDLAVELGSPMLNVNSDDLQNPIMLRRMGATGLPITCHDIGASLGEVEAAVTRLQEAGAQGPILLHSTIESGDTEEAYASANLRVMDTYRAAFSGRGALVGCVEHTTSDYLIFAVAALEPVLISKHLNLTHDPAVPDASISVDVGGLREMVRKVRLVQQALGEGANSLVADAHGRLPAGAFARRKLIVAEGDIPAGTVITPEHLAVKRPCVEGGLHPWMLHYLVGARAAQDIPRNAVISLNMLQDFPEVDWRAQEIALRRYGEARALV